MKSQKTLMLASSTRVRVHLCILPSDVRKTVACLEGKGWEREEAQGSRDKGWMHPYGKGMDARAE